MYTQAKPKLTIKHVLGYVAAGAAAIFGIITAFMTYFVTGSTYIGVATIIPFIIPACAAFVFLGLTQETKFVNYLCPGKEHWSMPSP